MQEIFIQIVAVFAAIAFADAGEVRCFCNLPQCVTSGYMCKSKSGSCFSDLLDYQDVYKARHGCMELLESDRQGQCQNEPGATVGQQRSLLLCCKSDMCNHVDGPEIKTRVSGSGITGHGVNLTETRVVATARYTNTEVWFKAATIAVPICGALILLLLIGLAIKLLRHDARYLPSAKSDNITSNQQQQQQPAAGKKLLDNNRLDYANECCSRPPKNTNYNVAVGRKSYDKQIIGLCEKSPPVAHV